MTSMFLSHSGLRFIAGFEGFREHAYKDLGGVWTIGYGHTDAVRSGQTVTPERALVLLHRDAELAERAVNRLVTVPVNQHRFDVLVSFTFNAGVNALKASNLLRRLNAGDYPGVPDELMRWMLVNGRPVAGLVRRRAAEAALWRTAA